MTQNLYLAERSGNLTLTLDNTYSKMRAKRVDYTIKSCPAEQDEDGREQVRPYAVLYTQSVLIIPCLCAKCP